MLLREYGLAEFEVSPIQRQLLITRVNSDASVRNPDIVYLIPEAE